MNNMKFYFENRKKFETDICNEFKKLCFDVKKDYELFSHMFLIYNKPYNGVYILSYDMDFENNIEKFQISKYDYGVIHETNTMKELLNMLYSFKFFQKKIRVHKLKKILEK